MTISKYTLRINKELLEKLKFIAEFNGRSANKEIEQIIKQYIIDFEKEHNKINI